MTARKPRRSRSPRKPHPLRTCDASASVLFDGTIEIRVAYLPPMNRGQGFSRWRYHRERTEIGLLFERSFWFLRPCTQRPWQKAAIRCTRMSAKAPDRPNNSISFKPWLDALQPTRGKSFGLGLIASDKPSCLVEEVYDWQPAKRGDGGIVIRVQRA